MIASGIDWTNVIVAAIFTVPSTIAAIAAVAVHRKVKTPSGTAIGKQVENALHTSLANNYRLRAIGGEVAPVTPQAAQAESDRATVAHQPGGTSSIEGGTA